MPLRDDLRKARYFGGVSVRGVLYASRLRTREELQVALRSLRKDARRAAHHALAYLGAGGVAPRRPAPSERERFRAVHEAAIQGTLSKLAKIGLVEILPDWTVPSRTVRAPYRAEPKPIAGAIQAQEPPAQGRAGLRPGRRVGVPAGPDLFLPWKEILEALPPGLRDRVSRFLDIAPSNGAEPRA
jgi:hypothetical protein